MEIHTGKKFELRIVIYFHFQGMKSMRREMKMKNVRTIKLRTIYFGLFSSSVY